MSLKKWHSRPPTGWVYKQPQTGFEFSSTSSGALLQLVRDHRIANNLGRTSDLEVRNDVGDYICGLLRGTRALWDWCETQIAFAPPHLTKLAANETVATASCGICKKGAAAS